jgi:hypothetical protein
MCFDLSRYQSRRPLISVLGGDIVSDGTRFVQNKSIVVLSRGRISDRVEYEEIKLNNIWDLTKRMFFEVGRRLVLPFTHFDIDEFEGDILLVENESDTQNVAGGMHAIELENHVDGKLGGN